MHKRAWIKRLNQVASTLMLALFASTTFAVLSIQEGQILSDGSQVTGQATIVFDNGSEVTTENAEDDDGFVAALLSRDGTHKLKHAGAPEGEEFTVSGGVLIIGVGTSQTVWGSRKPYVRGAVGVVHSKFPDSVADSDEQASSVIEGRIFSRDVTDTAGSLELGVGSLFNASPTSQVRFLLELIAGINGDMKVDTRASVQDHGVNVNLTRNSDITNWWYAGIRGGVGVEQGRWILGALLEYLRHFADKKTRIQTTSNGEVLARNDLDDSLDEGAPGVGLFAIVRVGNTGMWSVRFDVGISEFQDENLTTARIGFMRNFGAHAGP